MARNRDNEAVTDETANPEVGFAAPVEGEAAPEAPAEITPGVVTVENAVTEDQLREKVKQMLHGRKHYELCGVLKAPPSTIANFAKGKGGLTKPMLEGLGVSATSTYVIENPTKFADPMA